MSWDRRGFTSMLCRQEEATMDMASILAPYSEQICSRPSCCCIVRSEADCRNPKHSMEYLRYSALSSEVTNSTRGSQKRRLVAGLGAASAFQRHCRAHWQPHLHCLRIEAPTTTNIVDQSALVYLTISLTHVLTPLQTFSHRKAAPNLSEDTRTRTGSQPAHPITTL